MEHQTLHWWDDRPIDPAYYIEDCPISVQGSYLFLCNEQWIRLIYNDFELLAFYVDIAQHLILSPKLWANSYLYFLLRFLYKVFLNFSICKYKPIVDDLIFAWKLGAKYNLGFSFSGLQISFLSNLKYGK